MRDGWVCFASAVRHAPLYIQVYCGIDHDRELSVRILLAKKLAAGTVIALAAGLAQAGDLHVSAAASLSNAFRDIAERYEARHAGTKVLLNLGASGALLQQMAKGAPADVFASADTETMDAAAKQNLVAAGERRNFARNSLVVIVPRESKLAINRLQDLGQPAVQKVAIGNPASVPVGRYTQHALEAAKLWAGISARAINTQNVRQSLDYVARGEVDAGFVYGTDAAVMKDKVKVAFEVPLDVAISYPIARTAAANNVAEAKSFVDFVLSPAGQAVLAKYGFQKP
jgi:molybdate transport system substrate-binding protein